jgi:signal transduction histidine kinase
MSSSQLMAWIAGAIVLALIAAYVPVTPGAAPPIWQMMTIPVILVAVPVLWIRRLSHAGSDLREAGSGLRRVVFLAAYAGCVAMFLMGFPSFIKGFVNGVFGVEHRYVTSEDLSSQSRVAHIWFTMTAFIGIILDRLQRHRSRAEAYEVAAREARDQELRARLAPHFVFNTLNTLQAQIDYEPAEARATTQKLATLFRRVIDVTRRPTVSLAEELEFVEAYLGIERVRLGARLTVKIEVPEDLEAVEIPPLSLHVLVENAVMHGVAPSERGGTVVVRAERDADAIRLSVTDSGDGISQQQGSGTALDVLRQRLARPEDLVLERTPDGYRASLVWKMGRNPQ